MSEMGSEMDRRRSRLLESVPVAFLVTDVHSKILYANRQTEDLFGYKRSELIGQRIRLLFLKEDLIYLLTNILYLTRYKDGFDGEVLLRRKNGRKIFVHLYTTSFREQGEIFLAFTIQEIQRLKKLEQERLEAEHWASIGRMVDEITRRLRPSVSSIESYAGRLLRINSESDKGKTYCQQILRATELVGKLVDRVDEYVRMPRPVFAKENIVEVVESVIDEYVVKAKQHGITFSLETRGIENDGYLFIDRGLASGAISHVIENSIEAVSNIRGKSKKRSIRISLYDDGDVVQVAVADNGPGISKRNLQYVFEPFFSTHPDRIGLGLTFVRRVMWDHAGKTRIESRAGKGTVVTLYFPKDRRRKIRRELLSPEPLETGE